MSLLGQGMVQMIVVLGAFTGIGNIRTVRGVVLSIRQNAYVEAARAVGCPTWRILLRHVVPQVWPPIIVVFTVSLGAVILSESTISFLGFGIPPPQPSWGGMLSLEGRTYMEVAPLLALWPGLSLAIVVFGINMFRRCPERPARSQADRWRRPESPGGRVLAGPRHRAARWRGRGRTRRTPRPTPACSNWHSTGS